EWTKSIGDGIWITRGVQFEFCAEHDGTCAAGETASESSSETSGEGGDCAASESGDNGGETCHTTCSNASTCGGERGSRETGASAARVDGREGCDCDAGDASGDEYCDCCGGEGGERGGRSEREWNEGANCCDARYSGRCECRESECGEDSDGSC